ncbi:MAG: hypothetical protein SGPRY_000308 [Prymnesium sp.]
MSSVSCMQQWRLTLQMEGYEQSSAIILNRGDGLDASIFLSSKLDDVVELRPLEPARMPLRVYVHNQLHPGGCRKVQLYAPYWLVNKSGLPLLFREVRLGISTGASTHEVHAGKHVNLESADSSVSNESAPPPPRDSDGSYPPHVNTPDSERRTASTPNSETGKGSPPNSEQGKAGTPNSQKGRGGTSNWENGKGSAPNSENGRLEVESTSEMDLDGSSCQPRSPNWEQARGGDHLLEMGRESSSDLSPPHLCGEEGEGRASCEVQREMPGSLSADGQIEAEFAAGESEQIILFSYTRNELFSSRLSLRVAGVAGVVGGGVGI